jgi:hypothetical protein
MTFKNWANRYIKESGKRVEDRQNRWTYIPAFLENGGVSEYTKNQRKEDNRRLSDECGRCPQALPAVGKKYFHPVFGRVCQDCKDVLGEE